LKEWARLFHDYLQDGEFYSKAFKGSHKVSIMRAMPYEDAIENSEHVEILDYEKASEIIDQSKKLALGICSCRHEKHHLGEKRCDVPLEKCSTLGNDIDYLVRHGFAREVSKSEMIDNLAESKELGLIICADNVKKKVGFMCHCCGCCCNALMGISKFGFPEVVVTSNFIADNDSESCAECGECAEACPINAISLNSDDQPIIDEKFCLGCGVCALNCTTDSMKLVPRKQRVLHPENTFERKWAIFRILCLPNRKISLINLCVVLLADF
jgi:Pyruvate/2-oxoacid:ferredoxin oxidoreductase delta subunit